MVQGGDGWGVMVSRVFMGVVVAEVSRKLFCRGQIGCKIVAFKAEEVTPDQPFGVKVALFRTSAACCLHSI